MLRLVAALIGAALLESGGNAMLRQAIMRHAWPLLLAGLAMLGLYGILVNRGGLDLDFGRLMGCYIVAFFLISQILALVIFRELPSARTILGGGLILLGGLTILF